MTNKENTIERIDRSGNPDDDHWQTPQWLYDELNSEFDFDFDPCPIHSDFDGLKIEWGRSNFINPPYNREDKPKFIQKAYDEWRKGNTCVLLIPAATGTKQFHDLILPNAEVRFLKGRVAFVPAGRPRDAKATLKGKHDSMVVIFRGGKKYEASGSEHIPALVEALDELIRIEENTEELNIYNYNHDLVCQLNDGMNQIRKVISEALAALPEELRGR